MSGTVLLAGTRKGLFIGRAGGDRSSWTWDKPLFPMEEIYSAAIDTRGGRRGCWPARRRAGLGPAGVPLRRPRRTWEETRRRDPVPRGHRRGARAGLAAGARRPDRRGRLRRHRARCAVAHRPTAARRSSSIRGLWDHPHRPSGAPAFGGQAIHTVLRTRRPRLGDVAMSTGGVYQTEDGGESWEPRNRGIRAEFLPEGEQYPSTASACTRSPSTPAMPDRMYAPEPRRRLPLRRRRRPGSRSPTGCRPTSASRSSRTRNARHGLRVPARRRHRTLPAVRQAAVWRSDDAGETWRGDRPRAARRRTRGAARRVRLRRGRPDRPLPRHPPRCDLGQQRRGRHLAAIAATCPTCSACARP